MKINVSIDQIQLKLDLEVEACNRLSIPALSVKEIRNPISDNFVDSVPWYPELDCPQPDRSPTPRTSPCSRAPPCSSGGPRSGRSSPRPRPSRTRRDRSRHQGRTETGRDRKIFPILSLYLTLLIQSRRDLHSESR